MVWGAVLRGWHPPPLLTLHPHYWLHLPIALLPPPTQCCPYQPPVHPPPPPVASYWPSQPLAGRLRAIRPTVVGYVLFLENSKLNGSWTVAFSELKLRFEFLFIMEIARTDGEFWLLFRLFFCIFSHFLVFLFFFSLWETSQLLLPGSSHVERVKNWKNGL